MSDNAEEGIARAQAAATRAAGTQGDALRQHQGRGIASLGERILTYVVLLAMIGLLAVWATVTSPLVLYGSLVAVIALAVLWGVTRIRHIERVKRERAAQARAWRSGDSR